MLVQGNEMVRRGWKVTVASASRMKSVVEHIGKGKLEFVDVGACEQEMTYFDDLVMKVANDTDFRAGCVELYNFNGVIHPCMYPALVSFVESLAQKPDVVLTDVVTVAGYDIGTQYNIPVVVNNADLAYVLPPRILPAADYTPGALSFTSINDMSLLHRVLVPVLRLVALMQIRFNSQAIVNEFRSRSGLSLPTSLTHLMDGRLVLMNSAFPLEYPRPLPPLVQMVGPMVDAEDKLSQQDLDWINSSPLPIVFVSMGTLAPLSEHQVKTLFEGLTSDSFRVLWKLKKGYRHYLPTQDKLPRNQRVESWVSSQTGFLAHPKVKAFVSHCGINSAHETVLYQTAIMCVPMFADQLDMAIRLRDAGVGFYLDKSDFTAQQVQDTIEDMLRDDGVWKAENSKQNSNLTITPYTASGRTSIARNLGRVSSAMRLTGGYSRAVDLIEHVAQYGSESLMTADVRLPWYSFWRLDEMAVWLVVVWLLKSMVRGVYRVMCCGSERRERERERERRRRMMGKMSNGKIE